MRRERHRPFRLAHHRWLGVVLLATRKGENMSINWEYTDQDVLPQDFADESRHEYLAHLQDDKWPRFCVWLVWILAIIASAGCWALVARHARAWIETLSKVRRIQA